jgi:MoaA/NifB/PqqE/SkfB family radical SAM enzyme
MPKWPQTVYPANRNVTKDFLPVPSMKFTANYCISFFYFQGEPYLNPEFLEMVKYASQKNIYTATSTNAHYLTDENARKTVESGLDRLIISIDGTTQEVYQQYRIGGNLEKVIEGARNIVKWKKALNSKKTLCIFSVFGS